ncbi:MAG: STAS domain-containing protein [Chromatiaceae bacterium]|nr:MAG: STAS domain-containing protein [Chromatiaceae bacterium]
MQAVARGRYHLCGDLDLAAVAGLARAGRLLATAAAAAPVEVDLGGVGRSSSAAVALLLEWTEQVRQRGGRLHFTNWPAALVRIAGLSNVDGLLGCDPGQQQAGPDQHGR